MRLELPTERFQWVEAAPRPTSDDLAREVARGLTATPKRIPCRFFYDDAGSALFEEICALPEYYLTRAEDEILARNAREIAAAMPAGCDLVELGSGSARKTRRLIDALLARTPRLLYVPIDISRAALAESAPRLLDGRPGLSIRAVAAEYEAAWSSLDALSRRPKLVVWLGSNVGNLDRHAAARFLRSLGTGFASRDRLLLGIDLRKEKRVLEAAYDDERGVTARFNANVLARVNAELDADFDLARYRHVALYDEPAGRIEMHLESDARQVVRIAKLGATVRIEEGERIHTEDSYKYSPAEIAELARASGMRVVRTWLDSLARFSLNLLAPSPGTK